jgi:hypothetical protein
MIPVRGSPAIKPILPHFGRTARIYPPIPLAFQSLGADRFSLVRAGAEPLEPIEVEQPTMAITMGVNKSPFAGKSGAKLLTGRNIRDRLAKELEVRPC